MANAHDPEDSVPDMAEPDGSHELEVYPSPVPRRSWRRRHQLVAAIGVAAAVGTSVLVATQFGQEHTEVSTGVLNNRATPADTAVPSAAPGSSAGSEPSTATRTHPAAPNQTGTPAPAAPGPTATPADATTVLPTPSRKLRPLAPVPTTTAEISVTNFGSMPKDHHTLRVVSAKADLTGQRELAWAADSGHQVGPIRCTQNFHFSPDSSAGVRPTMMVCWRLSAIKSVYTVAVDVDHRPSEQAALTTINDVWSKLG